MKRSEFLHNSLAISGALASSQLLINPCNVKSEEKQTKNYKGILPLLQVEKDRIINPEHQEVKLRGVNIGAWMNMENFLQGYPGSENGLRRVMQENIGEKKAEFLFDRWLDHFFTEEDAKYLSSIHVNLVRIPVNYRHFENDSNPYQYLEKGFDRLAKAIEFCGKHNIYTIIDLHSVQGWQNGDWHCDNSHRHSFFWQYQDFQNRFVALWEEFANRFKGNGNVAGYNLINEPCCNEPQGRFYGPSLYKRNWTVINNIYKRTVESIRKIDPDHIIFLEGDYFATMFDGLIEPFVPNLIYSSHNYIAAGFGPGEYPGKIYGELWDKEKQEEAFNSHEGTQFIRKHNVPLWVGEFGAVYHRDPKQVPDRLRAIDDQISVFNKYGIHWTLWTYKDIGVMGLITINPDSAYIQAISESLKKKNMLHTDSYMNWGSKTEIDIRIEQLANYIEATINNETIKSANFKDYLSQATLNCFTGELIQYDFCQIFKNMSEERIDEICSSWHFKNCTQKKELTNIISKHLS